MDPFFTEEQLNNMNRENMMEVMRIMQNQVRKKETEVQLLKDKQKELEFMNAMLSDRLALAQRRRFGSSSEKYADGYEQMDLFNKAEANADDNRTCDNRRQVAHHAFDADHADDQSKNQVQKTCYHNTSAGIGYLVVDTHAGIFSGIQVCNSGETA